MVLQGRQRQGSTAEGRLVQVGQLIHQQHLNADSRQAARQVSAGGTGAHHQHRGLEIGGAPVAQPCGSGHDRFAGQAGEGSSEALEDAFGHLGGRQAEALLALIG